MEWKQVGIVWSQMVPLETVTITPSIYSMSLLSVPRHITTVPFTATPPLLRQISTMPPAQNIAVIEARIIAIASTTRAVTVRGSGKKTSPCYNLRWHSTDTSPIMGKAHGCCTAAPILSFHRPVNPKVPRSVATDNHFRHRSGDHRRPGCAGHILRQFKPALTSTTGTVRALQTETSMQWFFCNSKQDNVDARSKFHQCQQWKLNQKSDSYGQLFSGTMMLTTNNGILHLKISPETFTAYFNTHNLKRTLEDELEEHFLSQSHVSVTFDDENQQNRTWNHLHSKARRPCLSKQ
ncbi:hypothetical protein SRHO_G00101010 [Serrasalmus rhombeus]